MNAFYDCSMRMSGCVEPGRSCAVAAPTGPLPREANVHAAKTKPKADCLTVFCPRSQHLGMPVRYLLEDKTSVTPFRSLEEAERKLIAMAQERGKRRTGSEVTL